MSINRAAILGVIIEGFESGDEPVDKILEQYIPPPQPQSIQAATLYLLGQSDDGAVDCVKILTTDDE